MLLVLDASVIIKWLLAAPEAEADSDRAMALMEYVLCGRAQLLQPVHWLAEVAEVLVRLRPQSAGEDVELLQALELPLADGPGVWRRACELAFATRQHLFDTLYHAVSLENEGALLVTADARYENAARQWGGVVLLRDWSPAD